MVMQNIASYDGGKVIFGFGKAAYFGNASWIIKMWGNLLSGGTTACADASHITGYVNMVEGTNGELSASANCALTSDAKTQWAFTTQLSDGYTTGYTSTSNTGNRYSITIINGAEESACGGSAA